MPRRTLPLSELQIKKAKQKDRDYKLFDGDGLFLLVSSTGGKNWKFKYLLDGKERKISFGPYPEISLIDARRKRDDARSNVAHKVDPMKVKRAQEAVQVSSAADSLEVVSRMWHATMIPRWSDIHSRTTLSRLELNVFPDLGSRTVSQVTLQDVKGMLHKVEERSPETARRVLVIMQQVFRFCLTSSMIERSPLETLKPNDLLRTEPIRNHFPAITAPKELGAFLRVVDGFSSSFIVKCCLQLSVLLFQRPGDIRFMEWVDLDFEKSEWNIPVEKMKLTKKQKAERRGESHCVPLCSQAIEVLRRIEPLTRRSRYVFHGQRSVLVPISDAAVTAALHRLGFRDEMSWHGFRATARTMLDEVLEFPPDIIEHQLAHAVRDPLGRAYNRTTKLPQRRKMMQAWGDYLEGLRG